MHSRFSNPPQTHSSPHIIFLHCTCAMTFLHKFSLKLVSWVCARFTYSGFWKVMGSTHLQDAFPWHTDVLKGFKLAVCMVRTREGRGPSCRPSPGSSAPLLSLSVADLGPQPSVLPVTWAGSPGAPAPSAAAPDYLTSFLCPRAAPLTQHRLNSRDAGGHMCVYQAAFFPSSMISWVPISCLQQSFVNFLMNSYSVA